MRTSILDGLEQRALMDSEQCLGINCLRGQAFNLSTKRLGCAGQSIQPFGPFGMTHGRPMVSKPGILDQVDDSITRHIEAAYRMTSGPARPLFGEPWLGRGPSAGPQEVAWR